MRICHWQYMVLHPFSAILSMKIWKMIFKTRVIIISIWNKDVPILVKKRAKQFSMMCYERDMRSSFILDSFKPFWRWYLSQKCSLFQNAGKFADPCQNGRLITISFYPYQHFAFVSTIQILDPLGCSSDFWVRAISFVLNWFLITIRR